MTMMGRLKNRLAHPVPLSFLTSKLQTSMEKFYLSNVGNYLMSKGTRLRGMSERIQAPF